MSTQRHGRVRPSGVIIETLPGGKEIHSDTVRCVHCQRHWIWRVGSGRVRGWCPRCGGFTCGSRKCDVCVNWEQKLDNIEAGRPRDYKPVPKVSLWTPFTSRLDDST